jgi:hypothetical protein
MYPKKPLKDFIKCQISIKRKEFVECFHVAAMAIPRFTRELWRSEPQQGVKLYGGILPGRL